MFKKYLTLLLTILMGITSGSLVHAQNIPELGQTAPAGNYGVITIPTELGANLNSRNSIFHYRPKIRITNTDSVETALGTQVDKSVEYRDGNNQTYQVIHFNNSLDDSSQEVMGLVQPYDTRAQQGQYSFLPVPNANQDFQSNAFSASASYYSGLYPNEDYTSYSAKLYSSTSSYRETRNYAPGKSQVGQGRYTAERIVTNNAGQIRIWGIDTGSNPIPEGYYPANTLFGTQITDQEGHIVVSYKNKSGQLVLKVAADSAANLSTGFDSTYYVYDELGNLRFVLPPRSAVIIGNATVIAVQLHNKLYFSYEYDDKGRLTGQSKPGQNGALTEIVYDREAKPVMRRTPEERDAGKWELTFYDREGRVIATSLYSNSGSRSYWQDLFDNYAGASFLTNDVKYYLLENGEEGLYPPEDGVTGNTLMSYTWYDNYLTVDPGNSVFNQADSTLNLAGMSSFPGAELPERSMRTQGLVTGTEMRILPAPGIDSATTGAWTKTWNYYDDRGNLIYSVSKDLNHDTVVHQQLTGTEYDFSGKVIYSKHIALNKNSTDGHTTHVEETYNSYNDYTDQLTETQHRVDGGTWNILSEYKYDALGRIKREILGNYGEVRDYSYNIRGQLAGINGHYAETGDKQYESRTFGESLKYDYGFSHPRYDGKIAGMVWRGSGGVQSKALAYGYTYNPSGKLTAADFREGNYQNGFYIAPAYWDKDTMDYSVSNITYDQNGNILTKNLRGPGYTANNVPHPTTIDKLAYSYLPNSDRLSSVSDSVTTNFGDGDFQDGNTSGNDYAYDADGNLTQDLNKGIENITYTYFDKPQTITFANGGAIRYSYNAAGGKVQEKIAADSMDKTTDYTGNFVYRNDTLQYVSTPVGRTVWNDDSIKEEFFVKDHLGNLRSIVDVYHYPLQAYLATYEVASAQLEDLFFDDVDSIRADKPDGTDPGDTKAGKLNGADNPIGTSILLKVMAGDKVQLNVANYYDGTYNAQDDQPVSADNLLSSILSVLTGGEGGLGTSESHNPELVPKLFNPDNYTLADQLLHSNADPSRPKAFLNYVLFDANMQVVRTFTGAFQANGSSGWQTIGNTEPMTIPENGYLAVYLSNASDFAGCSHCLASEGDVYFDHLEITFTKGHLKEENGYYPYGLPMAGQSSTALGMTPNRQKYQSNEYITEAGLNWMSFGARQYDPQLGRFLSVDPLAAAGGQESNSPYEAMGDEPASETDPGGMLVSNSSNPPVDNNVSLALQFAPSTLQNIFGSGDIFGGGSGLDPLGIGEWMDATAQESGSSDVVILYDEAAQALVRLIQGASSLEITEAGLVMNFNNGDQAAFGFDGHLTWEPGASNAYACNNCSMEPDNTSTKILKGGVELAGATVVAGLGPEDPFADAGAGVILVGAAATAGAVWLYNHPLDISIDGLIASWWFSKGGKQGMYDDQLSPLSNDALRETENAAKAAGDKRLLQRIKTEWKRRGEANKQKRSSRGY